MFEKYFQKKINEKYDLDGFENRFLRKISCVTDWCHRDHIGSRYLSKKEEELKDEILIRGIKALSSIIHEVDEKVSIKVKEIQRDILAIFTDDGSESREFRRMISVTCETAIKDQLDILAKSSSLGDKSADIRTALNNIQKIIREY